MKITGFSMFLLAQILNHKLNIQSYDPRHLNVEKGFILPCRS